MKTRYKLLIAAAVLWELVVVLSVLSMAISNTSEKNTASATEDRAHIKSRLLCQTTNGQTFYDGVAFAVSASSGVVTFTPGDGPQTGLIINTTFPCTWTTLK